ncbi:hypothetical protein F4780DRAFT_791385 [Xylariomycetidae sp. FL0641]|nr:hypothetical protein F4780DRAFT_791385 [Xylariomycetidae sp. FL0641]
MALDHFRAIIIGGGPVGLAIANMLAAGGIDFVVLERYPAIVTENGAGIMLWPQSTRLFDQLGLLQASEGRYTPLSSKHATTLDGRGVLQDSPIFDILRENHGYPCANFSRTDLVDILYAGLGPLQGKVKTNAALKDIEVTDTGVTVTLADGRSEHGSLVIGADGAHSQTRSILSRLAGEAEEDGRQSPAAAASYQILYGRASSPPGGAAQPGVFYETHGAGLATQFTVSADGQHLHFGIYRRLASPPAPRTKPYSDEAETEAFAAAVADVAVLPGGVPFARVWARRRWARLADQAEGVAGRWAHGRVVLVGDAAVRMTSAAGLGFNTALRAGVRLVNGLQGLVGGAEEEKKRCPGAWELARVCAAYEAECRPEALRILAMSASMVRAITWESWWTWFFAEYVRPWLISDRQLLTRFGKAYISQTRSLDFLPKGEREGRIPWAA